MLVAAMISIAVTFQFEFGVHSCFAQFEPPAACIDATFRNAWSKLRVRAAFKALESYQSGVLISSDGIVLTVWSYVVDAETTHVTLNDGRKYAIEIVNYDPKTELALLRINETDLPFFELSVTEELELGTPVLAASNLFGVATGNEEVSIMTGVIASVAPLNARRGSFEIPYHENVLITDTITNNPGSAGGAIVDWNGNLLGLIGKEAVDSQTGTYLNFSYLISNISGDVREMAAGRQKSTTLRAREVAEPMTPELLGFALIPDVVERTPAYVDRILNSESGTLPKLRADDLILEVNGLPTPTIKDLSKVLGAISRDAGVEVTILRNGEFLSIQMGGK
ncbi:MAG: trypsin-like peptidase domain-containing protein [Pirellulaceae bacterium]